MVRKAWEAPTAYGSSMEGIKEKLKRLKREIKHWNMEVSNNTKNRNRQLLGEIEDLDQCDDDDNLDDDMRANRVDLLSQLRSLEQKEISMLKQKARVEWLSGGDTNSKFYYSRLRWKRAKNDIVGLRINGNWCEDVPTVKSQVKGYFECRFGEKPRYKINLDGVHFKSISTNDNDLLCSSIIELEILEAVSQCDSSKCPGPYGFNFYFIKNT